MTKDTGPFITGKFTLIAAALTGLFGLAGIYLTHYLAEQKENSKPVLEDEKAKEAMKSDTVVKFVPNEKPVVGKASPQKKVESTDSRPSDIKQSPITSKPIQEIEPSQVIAQPAEKQNVNLHCRYYIHSDERAKVQYFISGNKNSPPANNLLEHGIEIKVVDSYTQSAEVVMFKFVYGSISGWIPESKTKKRCQ